LSGFPENVIPEVELAIKTHLGSWVLPNNTEIEAIFFRRPLIPKDPNRSVGIFSVEWSPVENSYEMGRSVSPGEPTLSRYAFRIQSYVKHTDREEAGRISTYDTKVIRTILYRDPALRVRLTALSEILFDVTERLQRYGVARQRFINNEISGTFIAFTSTELWVETEST
jgi:hypothetical protein